MRKLHSFSGGIHPPEHKEQSTREPIAQASLASRLIVPLQQHMGAVGDPLVRKGQRVLKGQPLAAAAGEFSAATHAPTSGMVSALELHPAPHPSGLLALCAVIEPDGEDRWAEHSPLDWRNADPQATLARLRDGGVVGLGGAVFPTAVKARGNGRPVDTLIINGGECEPYITCDDMLMRERAPEISRGIEILQRLTGAREVVVGIEDNKPEAIAAMEAASGASAIPIQVAPVPTLYPAGGEKQLIKVITGREVPSRGLPAEVGVVCFNVATVFAVYRAVERGEPMVSRVVTVTGNVHAPRNFECLLGTPVGELAALADLCVTPTASSWVGRSWVSAALRQRAGGEGDQLCHRLLQTLFPKPPPPMPCIRCGRCAEACPAGLQPMDLYWFAKAHNLAKAEEFSLFDCIECGCCDYVCPSHIPLVQYYKFAKGEIRPGAGEETADRARRRHEFRQYRQDREKQERAARLASRAPGAKKAPAKSEALAESQEAE